MPEQDKTMSVNEECEKRIREEEERLRQVQLAHEEYERRATSSVSNMAQAPSAASS